MSEVYKGDRVLLDTDLAGVEGTVVGTDGYVARVQWDDGTEYNHSHEELVAI